MMKEIETKYINNDKKYMLKSPNKRELEIKI